MTVDLIHRPDVHYWLLSMLPSVQSLVDRCECEGVPAALIVVRWRGCLPPATANDEVTYSLLCLDLKRWTQEFYHPHGRNTWHTHAMRTQAVDG